MDKAEKDEIKDYVFGFECSVGWDNLEKTDDEDRRFCHRCNKDVYFARTQTELNETAKKGNCVAFPIPNSVPEPVRPVLAGYILPLFYDCKVCKKLIDRKGDDFGADVCPECRKSNRAPKKSWWKFWK